MRTALLQGTLNFFHLANIQEPVAVPSIDPSVSLSLRVFPRCSETFARKDILQTTWLEAVRCLLDIWNPAKCDDGIIWNPDANPKSANLKLRRLCTVLLSKCLQEIQLVLQLIVGHPKRNAVKLAKAADLGTNKDGKKNINIEATYSHLCNL